MGPRPPAKATLGKGTHAHQVQRQRVLFARQFIEHVPHLVIAASLHWLIGPKYLLDGCAQRFRAFPAERRLVEDT